MAEYNEVKKYGRLTVVKIERRQRGKWKSDWCYCVCDCGNKLERWKNYLVTGNTRSCGCLHKEIASKLLRTHGKTKHPLHGRWKGMIGRCYQPNHIGYPKYGGRGIRVCKQWKTSFQNFYDWMIKHGWESNHKLSIHRKNNDKGYCPNNCVLATNTTQQNNKSNNVKITAFNETKTVSLWAKDVRCAVGYTTLKSRIQMGWTHEKAITTPPRKITRKESNVK